jgi:hypothetical protein
VKRTFREVFVLRAAATVSPGGVEPAIIRAADEWAKACCVAWGHSDVVAEEDDSKGLCDTYIATCERCGRSEKRDWSDE